MGPKQAKPTAVVRPTYTAPEKRQSGVHTARWKTTQTLRSQIKRSDLAAKVGGASPRGDLDSKNIAVLRDIAKREGVNTDRAFTERHYREAIRANRAGRNPTHQSAFSQVEIDRGGLSGYQEESTTSSSVGTGSGDSISISFDEGVDQGKAAQAILSSMNDDESSDSSDEVWELPGERGGTSRL